MQLNLRTLEDNLSANAKSQEADHISTTQTKQQDSFSQVSGEYAALATQVIAAINRHDFYLASFLIKSLPENNNTELTSIRNIWLTTTKTLINEGQLALVESSLNTYLAFQPEDIDFLYLQIDWYLQQYLFLPAIEQAYNLQAFAVNEQQINNALNYARNLAEQTIDSFINNKQWFELRDLLEQISLYDPDYLAYQWQLAQAHYHLGEYEQAQQILALLITEPNYQVTAQNLLAQIEAKLLQPQSIELRRQGEHFIVQAKINNAANVSLMIDTGASISLLSAQAFAQLSQHVTFDYVKTITLQTAGGQVSAELYQVAEIELKGYVVKDFIFAVSPFESGDNDGLLGMNYLSAFDFYIDQTNNMLRLESK